MPMRCASSLLRAGLALAVVLALGACTPGGQFDPTNVFDADIFNTKKKIPGEREPLFPSGVPGAETGVPPDLVKGYQPPPEQAADNSDAAAKSAAVAAAAPEKPKPRLKLKPKPKPKPKPQVAGVSAPSQQQQDPVWNRVPVQTNWPAPPQTGSAQTNWPAPPQTSSAQTNWPAPPPTTPAQQPAQSIWPNPPAPATAPN